MKCLVTGAGGFIGSALSRELASRGCSMVSLVRDRRLAPNAGRVYQLELGRAPVEPEILQGVEVVYHCAGIAHQAASTADYERVNHKASLQLAAAAAAAGVRRFVFLSSVKAAESGGPYGYWKWRTEQALAAQTADSAMLVINLRPALVYGAGVGGNLRNLIRGVRYHLPAPPAAGNRRMIGLPDLVDALCLLGESRLGAGCCFEITDGQRYSTRRLYEAIRQGLDRAPGRAWLPEAGWRLVCGMLDLLKAGDDVGSYQKLFGEELYSNTQLCAVLDWQPRYSFEDLIGELLAGAD